MVPFKADKDVWSSDKCTHHEYCALWVDDLLYAGHDPDKFFKELEDIGYRLMGVGTPTYKKAMCPYLGIYNV